MASFLENLWASVFTPGPTPTLLRAANASFGALQVVLFILLIATYSIHFVILSLLSGALWYAINWFAAELNIAKAQQEEERARNAAQEPEDVDDSAPANDSEDTEVETGATGRAARRALKERKTAGSASREVEVAEDAAGELKKRANAAEPEKGPGSGSPQAGTQSSVSTEDEWEKVSENENEKDK
ncbi:ER protein Pkr1-domain-containing protein [Plectosphaerella cucumerina]|jgi:hypothetical protein|uniref:ER protein Pkr1-domain-containing protein n=1 Tax=Plectosphaerella cucumerina TaxID=40658 RepID=A0A8K0TVJ9_9PEZI|nr:ER protein Pkr1-domain-containing protein [Plectosphaerella cucumerina]